MRYRFRRPLAQATSLKDQLAEEQWDYLNWRVRGTHRSKLRKGTVLFIKHAAGGRPHLGWPPAQRPRWHRLRTHWRFQTWRYR